MKTKIPLVIIFALLCQVAVAQLQLGAAVVTRADAQGTGTVVEVFNVKDPATNDASGAGNNWGLSPMVIPSGNMAWNSANLGQVFGVAVNTIPLSPTPPPNVTSLIYVACSQIYPAYGVTYVNPFNALSNVHFTNYPAGFNDGTPLIWTLDPSTGNANVLVVSTTSNVFPPTIPNAIYNWGSGLGNICFDAAHNQIFATNFDDGRIYRIAATTGNVLSRYDPGFAPFVNEIGPNAQAVQLGKRIWGVGYNQQVNNTIYYSRWQQDFGDQTAMPNQIYSIPLTPTGDFYCPGCTGGPDYVDGAAHHEFDIPSLPGETYSSPVSDIKFSSNGNVMMVAERSMGYTSPAAAGTIGPDGTGSAVAGCDGWAHQAQVLRYNYSAGWMPSPLNYYVGNFSIASTVCGGYPVNGYTFNNTNAAGGVDFDYNKNADPSNPDECDQIIWATGDALKFGTNPGVSGFANYPGLVDDYVYGLAGVPITGNSLFASNPPPASNAVDVSSYYQDVWGNTSSSVTDNKAVVGDVVVYRGSCCSVVATLNVPSVICAGAKLQVTAGGGPYGQFVFDGQPQGINPVPPGGIYTFYPSVGDIGVHTVCFIAYSAMPSAAAPAPCSNEICTTITIQNCGCGDFIGNSQITANVPNPLNPMQYDFNDQGPNPDYITWYVDGSPVATTVGQSDYNYTFTTGGQHTVCMKVAFLLPAEVVGGPQICCYDSVCTTVNIMACAVWESGVQVGYTLTVGNYQNVTFTYTDNVPAPVPAIIWQFGDGSPDQYGGVTINHQYNGDGVYNACAIIIWSTGAVYDPKNPDASCCCFDTVCFTVNINPCSAYNFNVVVVKALPGQTKFQVNPNSTFGLTITDIEWSVDGGPNTSSGINTVSPWLITSHGTYPICATIYYLAPSSNGGTPVGCNITVCINYSDFDGPVRGLRRYFPNPNSGTVTVEVATAANDKVNIEIFSLLGQSVMTQQFESTSQGANQFLIDLGNLNAGIYQMEVTVSDKTKDVVKVVKQR